MTPLTAALTYQSIESDSGRHILLVCPACQGMLQIRPVSVGKSGHCVHCRNPLRAESDGLGGVQAVSLAGVGSLIQQAADDDRENRAPAISEAVSRFHEPSAAAERPTFASSARIPSRWGFPARAPEEDLTDDLTPPGFAEALFGEGSVAVPKDSLKTRRDQTGSPAVGPDDNPRENPSPSPAAPGQEMVACPDAQSTRSKHRVWLKLFGLLLAVACLSYVGYRFLPTSPWEAWRDRAVAWLHASPIAGSALSGQNREAAQP